jgi:ribosomal-protein-alanine N-acetyltransferase
MRRLLDVHVRWLVSRDVPEVLGIEAGSFAPPWSKEDLVAHLCRRVTIGMVAEVGDRVVGFMVYELLPASVELLRVAVHPAWRRRGAGAALLAKLTPKLSPGRRRRAGLDVGEANLGAHLWLKAQGWRAARVDRGRGGEPDTYRFVFRCPAESECEVPGR